jgi:hypothetical protein
VAYQAVLSETAKADANQIYDWIVERAPVRGPVWFEELVDGLYSLEQFPYRCPLLVKLRTWGVKSGAFSLATGSMRIEFFTKWTIRTKRCGFCTSGMERFEIWIPNNSGISVPFEVGLGNQVSLKTGARGGEDRLSTRVQRMAMEEPAPDAGTIRD